jgi:hypothetical protein
MHFLTVLGQKWAASVWPERRPRVFLTYVSQEDKIFLSRLEITQDRRRRSGGIETPWTSATHVDTDCRRLLVQAKGLATAPGSRI